MAFDFGRAFGEAFLAAGDALGRSQQLQAVLKEERRKDKARESQQRIASNRDAQSQATGARNQEEVVGARSQLTRENPGAAFLRAMGSRPGDRGGGAPSEASFNAGFDALAPASNRIEREGQVLSAQDVTDIVKAMAADPEMSADDAIAELRQRSNLRRTQLSDEQMSAAMKRFQGAFEAREEGEAQDKERLSMERERLQLARDAGGRDAARLGLAETAAEREAQRFEDLRALTQAQTVAQEQLNDIRKREGALTAQGKALESLLGSTSGVLSIRKDMLTPENLERLASGEIPLREALVDQADGMSRGQFVAAQLSARQRALGFGEMSQEELVQTVKELNTTYDLAFGGGSDGPEQPAPAPAPESGPATEIALKLMDGREALTPEEAQIWDALSPAEKAEAGRGARAARNR